MNTDLQHQLRQTKPFPSLEAEAVLRILRGADHDGLWRYEVGDRLATAAPAT